MRIAAHGGSRLHAPENTRVALISGYTAGADVLEFDLQLTKDGHLVLSHDGTTDRLTGQPGKIIEKTLAELRQLDFGETFQPRNSKNFHYYTVETRLLPVETFPDILERLPDDVELLIEMKHDSTIDTGRRDEFVGKALDGLRLYGVEDRVVLYSKDPENLRLVRSRTPSLRIAAFDFERSPEAQLQLLEDLGADGLVTGLDSVLGANGLLTEFGKTLELVTQQKKLRVGAVLYPSIGKSGLFSQAEYESLRGKHFVWSLSTDSMLEVAPFTRKAIPLVKESFLGKQVNREQFALGYAKANPFGVVKQEDGIHVIIRDYDQPLDVPPVDVLDERLQRIETKLMYTAKDWPFYSGGGVGHVPGIRGDFSAEVDYTVENVTQATTLEMAVTNVNPGAHQGKPPGSFRGKDSFYDPHGAPPFCGVEHDEDDGYRINWNLGAEYDNNQYGRPVGDGKTPRSARMRLERRGPYFSAYYRNDVDAKDWVCCGVTRNDSLNPVVYLRCVGKRWRQENPKKPDEFLPIVPNHFIFTNLEIVRYR